ncbi:peptidoglycan amidohydrolase family protein [Turicibacter sp.]|uniref:peptidoglycan amidohydrolase family protein n=1 Tax=Turicibacter sp. TaxID=2049042 RepID=UPI001B7BFCDD|nr:peptidoglycan amidohydrolase family protein [Turicibacter sp.]MBP3903998.1 hypothetical protein [Turicibacter sp.]
MKKVFVLALLFLGITINQEVKADMNIDNMVNESIAMKGRFTYSMYGSRTGADGTADCSGFVYRCALAGGAKPYPIVPSTETQHDFLLKNGFTLISENRKWNMQKGDIIIWGKKGWSAGAGGHTGIAIDNQNWAECTAWLNLGTTIQNHDKRYAMNGNPYFYVYRYTKPQKPMTHDEAVKASPVFKQGSNFGKLDYFNEYKKDVIRVAGWLVPENSGRIGSTAWVIFRDKNTKEELTRIQSRGIPRPDVKKAYNYSGGDALGFDVTVNKKQLKGHQVEIVLRRSDNGKNGEPSVNDVAITGIYLTL